MTKIKRANTNKVVDKIYKDMGGKHSKETLKGIINDFFSSKGLRYFTRYKWTIDIPYFGRFYYKEDTPEMRKKLFRNLLFKKNKPRTQK